MTGMSFQEADLAKVDEREAAPLAVETERSRMLSALIEECDPKRALQQDRASCMDEQLFLRSASRSNRPVAEIVEVLRQKIGAARISGERRSQIEDHIARLVPLQASAKRAPVIIGGGQELDAFDEDTPTKVPFSAVPNPLAQPVRIELELKNSLAKEPHDVLGISEGATRAEIEEAFSTRFTELGDNPSDDDVKRLSDAHEEMLKRLSIAAADQIAKLRSGTKELPPREEGPVAPVERTTLKRLRALISETRLDAERSIEGLKLFNIVGLFDESERQLREQYAQLISSGITVPGYQSAITEGTLLALNEELAFLGERGNEIRVDIREYIINAVRHEVYRDYLASLPADRFAHSNSVDLVPAEPLPLEAHQILGVPRNASRLQIDKAYVEAMATLDMDRLQDRREIAELQRAHEQMVSSLEAAILGRDRLGRDREPVARFFSEARNFADRYVSNTYHGVDRKGVLYALADAASAVVEAEHALNYYEFPPEIIRSKPTDAFFEVYFFAMANAGRDSDLLRRAVREYINVRSRLAALLRLEATMEPADIASSLSAFELLGVSEDVDRNGLEGAFLSRMAALDLDRAEDAHAVRLLQESRDSILERIEEREAADRAAEEARDKEAFLPHSVELREREAATKNASVRVVSPGTLEPTEGLLTRLARKPGHLLRGLIFGGAMAAGAGAGAVALNHLPDAPSAAPHDYSLGVIPGPFDGVGDLSGLLPKAEESVVGKIEAPAEQIRLVPHGSTVWGETVGMLRERGLKPTRALTSYFEHRIEEVNRLAIEAAGGVNHLPDNFPLIVTPIVEEMNETAGVAPVASEPLIVKKSAPESSLSVSAGQSVEQASVVGSDRVVPTVDSPKRLMAKGEYLGKVTHSMLRAANLNFTFTRINQLNDLVWQQNLPLFEQLVKDGKMRKLKPEYIPVGVELDFSSAAREVQRLAAAKRPTKKGK